MGRGADDDGAGPAHGWAVAARIAAPILLVTTALAVLWVEGPVRDDEELKGIAPPASASPPPPRELTYEPWELVKT